MTTGLRSPAHIDAVAHTRVSTPVVDAAVGIDERVLWLANACAEQAGRTIARLPARPDLHVVCSTTLSKMVSGHDVRTSMLFDAIGARSGSRPAALLLAYQCAGWGYALRFAAAHSRTRVLLLTIVDADLHDMMRTGYEAAIDRIGYGVTTVALELRDALDTLRCDGPFANRGFADLLHAVRRLHQQRGISPTFLPFLPQRLADIARRSVGEQLGRNRHDAYGHTFGADPWIGLVEWLRAEPPEAECDVTLGAFAFDGYYTAATLRVGPRTATELHVNATESLP
ncbi:hypothetical protein DID96_29065 [Burkholderia sp. Bp8963]|uniref:hypothetical protein n=1 Tax=Burkholderia sp. Bp8963 TaxID=2184547 RepID=UPI000F5A7B44|nr:hypothetical protein [Burkholderia sp. Bp8963]RQS64119.1 hypothetical protein DID96_29065 [Burkholderia sp. Bp8963]